MQHTLHAVILGIVVASASCASTNSAGNRTEVDTLTGRSFTEKGDFVFDKRVEIVDIRYRETGGFLEVQASLKNHTKDDIQGEVSAQWYDGSGWELTSANQPWRQLIIHGLEQKEVVLLAPRTGAAHFKIAVRADNAYRP
ncbi:MAG: DUF1425 domain-containing protein [Planctomycetes bacterium]|nr:DUF1425 domain-containing protein [Planctomycetota bacterium]MBI3846527.1 DUF1425 domain-containing protein [Planctomycetota bacterium]